MTSSINALRYIPNSKDASIAEVNEDLYKDSVESAGGDHEDIDNFD